jgi:hypothetical protein
MKIIMNVILIVIAFSFISGVSADKGSRKQSAESFVMCGSGNGAGISERSLPETINGERCMPFGDSYCAACIVSLENQGCKIVDVVVTHFRNEDNGVIVPGTSYLLSCAKP